MSIGRSECTSRPSYCHASFWAKCKNLSNILLFIDVILLLYCNFTVYCQSRIEIFSAIFGDCQFVSGDYIWNHFVLCFRWSIPNRRDSIILQLESTSALFQVIFNPFFHPTPQISSELMESVCLFFQHGDIRHGR